MSEILAGPRYYEEAARVQKKTVPFSLIVRNKKYVLPLQHAKRAQSRLTTEARGSGDYRNEINAKSPEPME